MAFYECKVGGSGGGIPPQLQSDMDAVFNKKFGTTGQSYSSSDWAKDVNVMGLLPEKTVSGSVASFSDGADDVPIKTATFDIDPTLTGVSAVNVVRTGKNLLPSTSYKQGYYNTSGVLTSDNRYGSYDIYLNAGSYVFSTDLANCVIHRYLINDVNTDVGNPQNSLSFTLTKRSQFKITIRNSSYAEIEEPNSQIEIGSTATTYEPYTATTRTISLGQTVYGGSVTVDEEGDVSLDETQTGKSLSGRTWIYDSTYTRFRTEAFIADVEKQDARRLNFIISSPYTACTDGRPIGQVTDGMAYFDRTGYFYIHDANYTDPTAFGESLTTERITFPSVTPTASTLTPITPINTLLGVNNIWCDTGDSEVTYRADIALALNS